MSRGSLGSCRRVPGLSHGISLLVESAADISRRFLAGLVSGLLSATAAAAFRGDRGRRDLGRVGAAEVPRSCSTSLNALISALRRSISLCRSAIACAMTLMAMESSGPVMGMSITRRERAEGAAAELTAPPGSRALGGGRESASPRGRSVSPPSSWAAVHRQPEKRRVASAPPPPGRTRPQGISTAERGGAWPPRRRNRRAATATPGGGSRPGPHRASAPRRWWCGCRESISGCHFQRDMVDCTFKGAGWPTSRRHKRSR